VLDPTEGNERVRAVEVTDPWSLEIDWCICGRFADLVCGCWCVQVFIDDIDGVGPTHGLIGSQKVAVRPATSEGEDTATKCYETTFTFPAGSVGAGVYDLVVLITLSSSGCDDDKARLVQDMVGWAVIPVLVFFDENAPFCPEPPR
jgi:hypothetical protein